MTRPRIRVVKVGGSLLACQRLPQLLTAWLAQENQSQSGEAHPSPVNVLIAGGGALVDQVRELDQRFALDAETSHWMSVSAMGCTSQLLARLLNVGPPVQRWEGLPAIDSSETPSIVFDVRQWLTEVEASHRGVLLTRDWRSTSDSIAARLAWVLGADELVLLKSTDMPRGIGWRDAAEQGLVDAHFPTIADTLPRVTWVNLHQAENLPASHSLPAVDRMQPGEGL